MVRMLGRFLLYRVVGGRVMLAMALLGLARRLLGGRRRPGSSAYQPSQGSSQIAQRDPR